MGKKRGRNSGTSSPTVTPESKTPESKRPTQRTTPETRRLSFTSATTMTRARPKIIRTSFDDVVTDKCVLTDVLDTIRHDKTYSEGKYKFPPP